MKLKIKIQKLNVIIAKHSKKAVELYAKIVHFEKMKTDLQATCQHKKYIKSGHETGSGRTIFTCLDCDYVGKYSDFHS